MNTVTLVDFGAGNLLSVMRAFRHLDAEVKLASTPEAVLAADRLVLPGVGAFGACMGGLRARDLIEPVKEYAASGRPFLGICVGMQMLFDESEEFGANKGLGLIPGRVVRIPSLSANGELHKVPHIGWNSLHACRDGGWRGTPLEPLGQGANAYFVHSYAAYPKDGAHRLAECDYNGIILLAAACKDNVTGCQFHPEKSGKAGLSILTRFLEI
ncbi:Imidazole glycerol phosphate synthase subunit HisH 1 [Rhodospirillaceae bacterium LM-1]|nr:Imidazole glycerol phosphate synthase subunit HisH 1 [Rhodospirillaceae bacterium LM-1]